MNKGILVGGGVGLLMLLLLGGYWIAVRAPEPQLPAVQETAPAATTPSGALEPSAAGAPGTTPAATPFSAPTSSSDPDTGASAPSPDPSRPAPWSAAPVEPKANLDKKPMTREERRAIRAQVRTKMTELLAKGQSATAEDAQAFINDVEKLGQGIFDPRYFTTMREMIAYSARSQELSQELARIAYSKAAEDVARQQEILSEMRGIGDRVSNGAAALQSYARDVVAGEKP